MKTIKIDFVDFWYGFNKTDNYFYNILKDRYNIIISEEPDFLFFSVNGFQNRKFGCTKIFYTGENIEPDFNFCDYALSFDYIDDPRNKRLPLYLLYPGYYELTNKEVDERLLNRNFCNFISSNNMCHNRNNFFNKLSKYKKVDSGGGTFNNIGYKVKNKREFQSNYKFSIAYENEAYRYETPGYTTEKILDPMTVNSIPIYWGNPLIDLEFNSKSFVNFYDFKDEDEMIEYIIKLDNDDDMYMSKLREPWFVDNKIPEENKKENISNFLYKIIEENV